MLPKNVLRLVVALTLLSLAFSSLLPSNELGDSKLPQRKLKEGKGYWSTKGNRIVDEDGDLVFFSGINWNGFESANCIVDGLWVRSYSSYLDQMKVLGFNLIRLPFAGSCVQEGVVPIKTAIDLEKNPDLLAKTSIEAMQSVVQAAGDKGMRVILDYHRRDVTDKTGKPEDGLWYNETYPTSYWLDTWKSVATALKDYDAVVGVDLFNEPHFGGAVAPVWDMSTNDNNWRYAALTAAEAILEINPAWLICVEGMYYDANWGGNLIPLLQYPLNLTEPNKLVYSIHEYGPYVANNTWLKAVNFPDNLQQHWDNVYGFVHDQNIAPVWVGEFGTKVIFNSTEPLALVEKAWFQTFLNYIDSKQLVWTYFTWGPNSVDTGGILMDDWTTVNMDKILLLEFNQYSDYSAPARPPPPPPLPPGVVSSPPPPGGGIVSKTPPSPPPPSSAPNVEGFKVSTAILWGFISAIFVILSF